MILPNSWDDIMKEELSKPYIAKLEDLLDKEYSQYKIFPNRENIFTALELTDYNNVKCVILGQDPYPSRDKNGNSFAHGLAFSSKSQYNIPQSLKSIYKELSKEYPDYTIPTHGNLTKWAEQGVLLLNTVLTVRSDLPNSHVKLGWHHLTKAIIHTLGFNDKPIVFCLWGNNAQAYIDDISHEPHKLVLCASHPSPLSARVSFFGCNHFKMVNEFLEKQGLTPIDWQT